MASGRDVRARSELEAEALRREAAPTPVADAFDALLSSADAQGRVRSTWNVTRAWYSVNGDYERAHTVGTFVEQPRRAGALPVLVVYVDTKSCEVDFMANREIYLARLEQAGLRFREVRFRQSKRPRAERDGEPRRKAPAAEPPLPELSAEEERRAEELLASVPETLRQSVSRAVRVSMRAEKRRNS